MSSTDNIAFDITNVKSKEIQLLLEKRSSNIIDYSDRLKLAMWVLGDDYNKPINMTVDTYTYDPYLSRNGVILATTDDAVAYDEYAEKFKAYALANNEGKPVMVHKYFDEEKGAFNFTYSLVKDGKELTVKDYVNVVSLRDRKPKVERKSFFDLWQANKSIPYYDRIVCEPNKFNVLKGDYNLWQGFIEPKEGDVSKFLDYIDRLIIGTQAEKEHILKLLAWTIQYPDRKPEACIALRGEQGSGKSSLGMVIQALCPAHTDTFTNFNFVSEFNSETMHTKYFLLEESVWGGDVKREGILKDFLTNKKRKINTKFFPSKSMKNFAFCILTSNEDWIAPVGKGDRRYNVFDCKKAGEGDTKYWDEFYEWLNGEGKHAIMDYMLKVDLTGFNHRKTIDNSAKADVQKHSFRGINSYLYSLLSSEISIIDETGKDVLANWDYEEIRVERALIQESVDKVLRTKPSAHEVSAGLNKAFSFIKQWRVSWKGSNGKYYYKLPKRSEAMALFAKSVSIEKKTLFADYVDFEEILEAQATSLLVNRERTEVIERNNDISDEYRKCISRQSVLINKGLDRNQEEDEELVILSYQLKELNSSLIDCEANNVYRE